MIHQTQRHQLVKYYKDRYKLTLRDARAVVDRGLSEHVDHDHGYVTASMLNNIDTQAQLQLTVNYVMQDSHRDIYAKNKLLFKDGQQQVLDLERFEKDITDIGATIGEIIVHDWAMEVTDIGYLGYQMLYLVDSKATIILNDVTWSLISMTYSLSDYADKFVHLEVNEDRPIKEKRIPVIKIVPGHPTPVNEYAMDALRKAYDKWESRSGITLYWGSHFVKTSVTRL